LVPLSVDLDRHEGALDHIAAALRERQSAPLLELGDGSLGDEGILRDPDQLSPEPLVRAQPRVEEQPVVPAPFDVPLDRGERIAVLEARAHRRDEVPVALEGEAAHVLEHQAGKPSPLAVRVDQDRQGTEPIGRAALEAAAERVPPARGHPAGGDRVSLGEQLAVVDENELKLRPLLVQAPPVCVGDRVVEDDLGPGPSDLGECGATAISGVTGTIFTGAGGRRPPLRAPRLGR
jgi:hypothetical protein